MRNLRNEDTGGFNISWMHSSIKPLDQDSLGFDSGLRDLGSRSEIDAATDESLAPVIVVIEKRAFVRECLTRSLKLISGHNVNSFPTVDSWLAVSDSILASFVVLCVAGKPDEAEMRRDLSLLAQSHNPLPTIILSDVEEPDEIIKALNNGARGYIPTSVPLEIAVEAMRLVKAGGVFAPASSLVAMRPSTKQITSSAHVENGPFTARQTAVVEALRRGKSNKIIAYELNLRESTVKVHIRNIMKKLKAKNRTEVAYMTNDMLRPTSR